MSELTKENWIVRGRTGASSKTIWAHFMLNNEPHWPCAPYDPSDFLRCYWLLKLAPEWKLRLGELGLRYPRWKPLAEHWEELESMLLAAWPHSCASGDYEDELPAKSMYARMQQIKKQAVSA